MCSCLVIQLQSAEVSRTVTSSFVWSWTISVDVNEGIQDPEIWTQDSSFVTALFTIHAQQTPVHLMWGLLRVCAACPTARLNWSSSSVPPGTTSTIHSPSGPRRIQQSRPTFSVSVKPWLHSHMYIWVPFT